MTEQWVERIKAMDPALRMPPMSPNIREATRTAILASDPHGSRAAQRPVRTTARARRRIAIVLAAAALLIAVPAGGAWAYISYFTGPQTVMDEFRDAEEHIALPAGYSWNAPDLPDRAVFGSRMGLVAAVGQAIDAWFQEMLTAHQSGDIQREQAAFAGVERVIAIAPVHKEGDPEEAGGFVEQSIQYFYDLVGQARQGDYSGIQEFLAANQ
jgi:hypothetical protein